jgi:hypothetical protein
MVGDGACICTELRQLPPNADRADTAARQPLARPCAKVETYRLPGQLEPVFEEFVVPGF